MLDLMRQANRRKWFVWIVIMFVVAAFVISIFAIWGGAATGGTSGGPSAWLMRVNEIEVTPFELERHRTQVENQYRQIFGDQIDQQASAFNFDQIALRQLLGQALAYSEAKRLGLTASEAEVADTIVHAPVFQRNGRFIGREQYLNELRGRGYNVGEYEEEVGKQLAVDKLRDLVGTMVGITDAEVDKAFVEQGQTAEVDYVFFKESDFPVSGEPSAREIEAYYRDHRSTYLTPEKRRAAYIVIERDPLQSGVEVTDAEIKDDYEANKESTYRHPEQRRASHILLKTPPEATPEQVEATRATASALVGRARAGEDFAKLAREVSEDTGSAQDGGDLDWFGKGRMVPEFEKAVFDMSEGQISDPVKTSFGFHIIKLTGTRPDGVTPLEEVRDAIRQQVAFRKAQDQLSRKADEFTVKLGQQTSSFEGTAAEMGFTVKDTGMIAQGDPMGDLGPMPQVASEVFQLKPGANSGPIPSPRGIVFARLVEVQQPAPAPFESVKDRVKADSIKARSLERARAAARELTTGGAEDFKAAADRKKLEVKSTGEFSRPSAPPEFSNDVKTQIFSHKANDLIGPLDTTDGVVVVKIIKRGPEGPEQIALVKTNLRDQLLQQKRDEAFAALLQRLQHSATIEYNTAALEERERRAAR